jgi:dihydroorotate dehydrogenase
MATCLPSAIATTSLPFLLRLDPELAHRLAMGGLKLLRSTWPSLDSPTEIGVECLGLLFAHPVGVAAGFDKDGDYLDALGAVGFSHIEVGTVTPRPQPGNPKPRLFRIPSSTAVVNRMGFNSKGVAYVVRQLRRSTFRGVRGVSIGKNATTPIEHAANDYLVCFRTVYAYADYVAVNLSSPNSSKLRELQTAEGLGRVIGPLQEERIRLAREHGKSTPILVKLAPDLTLDRLSVLASEMRRLGVDGVIATNTTVNLDGVRGVLPIHQGGGLSGQPLHEKSLAVISALRFELGPSFPIIGVGGITNADAALASLSAGANLLQLYTGLIYRGPALLYEILDKLQNTAEKGYERSDAQSG